MIKKPALVMLVFAMALQLRAQENRNVHLGLGSISNFYPIKHKDKIYQGTGIGSGIRLGYEQDFKNLSTGKLTLGGILAIGRSSANASFNNWKSEYRWRHSLFAARLVYAYPVDSQLDLYGGLHMGVQFERFTHVYATAAPALGYVNDNYFHSAVYAGAFFGASYKLSDRFGAFAELGYDLMWFTLGAKVYL